MSFSEVKLYFFRTLYSWSQVLDSGTNKTMDFVDNIMHESLRAFFWKGGKLPLLYMGEIHVESL